MLRGRHPAQSGICPMTATTGACGFCSLLKKTGSTSQRFTEVACSANNIHRWSHDLKNTCQIMNCVKSCTDLPFPPSCSLGKIHFILCIVQGLNVSTQPTSAAGLRDSKALTFSGRTRAVLTGQRGPERCFYKEYMFCTRFQQLSRPLPAR